jgi:hypothetical protein
MAYSNVTPPPLPEYDTEIYGFYILVFSYEIGAEDWYSVQLRYAPWRFSYDEALGITNGGNNFLQVYGDGTWGDWGQNQETLAIKPGQVGKTYQRIYTNHNIFDANDEIYMAADTILPPDENRFPILDFLNGLVMALCGRPIQWPSREPESSLFLYGYQTDHPEANADIAVALRDGDVLTYYVGVVYPALPVQDTGNYSNFILCYYANMALQIGLEIRYFDTEKVATFGGANNELKLRFYKGEKYLSSLTNAENDNKILCTFPFGEPVEKEAARDGFVTPLWSNYTIYGEDGSVFYEPPAPIPVSGVIGYDEYNIPIYEVMR